MIKNNFPHLNIVQDAPDMPGTMIADEILRTPTQVSTIRFMGEDGLPCAVSATWFEPPKLDVLRAAARERFGSTTLGYSDYCRLAYTLDEEAEAAKPVVEAPVQKKKEEPPKADLKDVVIRSLPLMDKVLETLELDRTPRHLYALYAFLEAVSNYETQCPDKELFESLASEAPESIEAWF